MMEYKLDLILMRVAAALLVLLIIGACTIRLRDDACETDASSSSARDFDHMIPWLGPSHITTQDENDPLLACGDGSAATRGASRGESTAPSILSDRNGCRAPRLGVPLREDGRPTPDPDSAAIPAPEGR
jgi:hypothetical protein